MKRPALAALLLAVISAGCGEVVPYADPDGGAGPDATDDVALEATSPAAGAVSVEVVTAVTLRFTGALDPDSLDGALHVFERSSRREVPVAEVDFDDTTATLTATLVRPLQYGTEHRVEVDGLTAGGVPVAVPTFRFRTDVNEYRRYRKWVSGRVIERADYALDDRGFGASVAGYQAGTDGAFDTADDTVAGWSAYQHADDGAYTSVVSYGAAGADATWMTGDDVISSYTAYDLGDSTAGHHRIRSFAGAGADGQWQTADDVIASWQTFAYDDQDRLIRQVSYNGAGGGLGADGVPHTADDVAAVVYATAYPNATTVEQRHYNGPGNDGIWLTGDDALFRRTVTTLDDAGVAIATRYLDAAGTPLQHQVTVLDASGLPWRSLWFTAAGADATWFTADDIQADYRELSYDAEHRRIRNMTRDLGRNGTGPDGDDRDVGGYFDYDVER